MIRPNQDTSTAAIADQWAGVHCWLDGKHAKITGRLNHFATVATTDGTVSVEFSCHTVGRIMHSTREFSS